MLGMLYYIIQYTYVRDVILHYTIYIVKDVILHYTIYIVKDVILHYTIYICYRCYIT